MSTNKKYEVLSCIQPTGEMHLGNYFGAVKNWVALQEKYNCIYGIVDLHAITVPYTPEALRNNTLNLAIDLLACGIDTERSILFIQSLVPQHSELAWIFNCITSYGELQRQTQFKEKSDKVTQESGNDFISTGLFTYPVLQAADILVYRAKYVPVGQDQRQHLELTRNVAERFNYRFGEYFELPEPLFTPTAKVLSLADPTKKMSKSLGEKHWIGLFEDEKSIRQKISKAVTATGESGGEMAPGVANLLEMLRACGKESEYQQYTNDFYGGTLMYGKLKTAVVDAIVELTEPFKRRKAELLQDTGAVQNILRESSEKAREIAAQTLHDIRPLLGLPSL